MWTPWRKKMRGTSEDASRRLAAAHQVLADNVQIATASSPIAEKSRELAKANSIAALLRDSVRPVAPKREG